MTTEDKLRFFLDSSIESATNQSTQLIDDYQKALNLLFEDHKADMKRQAQLQIRLGRESIELEMNKELSREQIQIKRELAKKEAALKAMLFSEIEEILAEFMTTPEYQELLVRQIKEACAFAGEDEITIYIDPTDADRIKELEAAANASLTVSKKSFMGGVRALIRSKNILIDNSFETQLKEAREAFAFHIN